MNVRTSAAKILVEVLSDKHALNIVLAEQNKQYTNPQDRGFVQELCYGVLRWYEQLDAILKLLLKHPLKAKDGDVKALLLLGIYQLLHLKTPPHAALNETVNAVRDLKKPWASGLVNGVLRQFQREQAELLAKVNQTASARYAFPRWLLKQIQQAWPEQWEQIVIASNQRPPMTLRVNQNKASREQYLTQLTAKEIAATPAMHTTNGLTLAEPCDVAQLPDFFAGAVSVQDAAAQLAADLLMLAPAQRVLDACAAPGGKAAHILETETQLAQLCVLDIVAERLKKIKETFARLNFTDEQKIILRCADATQPEQWWDGQQFDRILLDAPCSATGVIRRHPDIKFLRRAADIAELAKLQNQLLTALWPLLKPGGVLLYVTCSLLPQENTQVLEEFLAAHPDAQEQPIPADWGIKTAIGRQILPEIGGMDGFYYARLVKTG